MRYGTGEQLVAAARESIDVVLSDSIAEAFKTDSPTLAQLQLHYGAEVAEIVVELCIQRLNDYVGVSRKLSPGNGEYLARLIIAEHGCLKPAELQLFFQRLKSGRYERFYGAVDPVAIIYSLESFMEERGNIIDRMRRAAQQAADAERNRRFAEAHRRYDCLVEEGKIDPTALPFYEYVRSGQCSALDCSGNI